MKWWRRKKVDRGRWEFVSCLTEVSKKPLANPGRGWYTVYSFRVSETPDVEALSWCIDPNDRLALVLLDIGECSKTDLTEAMLAHVRQIFEFFIARGLELIVRPVYDTEGKGMEKEPPFLDQIQRHMEQLGSIFHRYADNICTLQGLLIGSWGEMHDSRHLTEKKLKELAETLWKATEGSCYIAVRTPWQKRLLEGCCVPSERIGLFNDGLFGSDTHLGSFGSQTNTEKRGEPWQPELELSYLEQNSRQTPNGGEAVYGGQADSAQTLDTLKRMHITYLNRTYDDRLLKQWKQQGLYDEVGLRLGYRFAITGAWMEDDILCIEGINEGFANLYQAAHVSLLAAWLPEKEAGPAQETVIELQDDPRSWESGQVFCIKVRLPEPEEGIGTLRLFLELRQENGEYIRFANESAENRLYLGFARRWRSDL